MKATKKTKKKIERRVSEGIINIRSSFNNTVINLTDTKGDTLAWATAGSSGFKGTKKATPFAASQIAKTVAEKAKTFGISTIEIKVKGVGAGRESAIRTIIGSGISVSRIKDVTPIPHGGVRSKKVRRV